MKLIAVVEAYQTLLAIQNTNKIPIGLAWQIADHLAEMAPTAKRFEEQRLELAKKFGDVDKKDPNIVQVRKKEEPKFTAEFEELCNIEIEMNGTPPITKEAMLSAEIEIPPEANLAAIRAIITADPPAEIDKAEKKS